MGLERLIHDAWIQGVDRTSAIIRVRKALARSGYDLNVENEKLHEHRCDAMDMENRLYDYYDPEWCGTIYLVCCERYLGHDGDHGDFSGCCWSNDGALLPRFR
jgi:hypothetical protein